MTKPLLKILFVADGRSPIALNWMKYFVDRGMEVHLAATYPCVPDLRLKSLEIIPAAFGDLAGDLSHREGNSSREGAKKAGAGAKARVLMRKAVPIQARSAVRHWLGPLTLPKASRKLQDTFQRVEPDLVHAMRIPYEGMAAALARPSSPLIISVWGNDFTLHASSTPTMTRYTRLALDAASGLHTDCYRDLRLAKEWGFPEGKPAVVLPTNGGIRREIFFPREEKEAGREGSGPVYIINPRGYRAYVRNDTFFRSLPLILEKRKDVRFLCPSMSYESEAHKWVKDLGIERYVDLLPRRSQAEMADLFQKSQIVLSPTTHDGTPNSLLEALACGCFPIAGDIESIREWIEPGKNGLLVDPANPEQLAQAVLQALEAADLRREAFQHNQRLIDERAEYGQVMRKVEEFYEQVVSTLPNK
jgi:glycosyltransferase involved in cell wall biosynthesis